METQDLDWSQEKVDDLLADYFSRGGTFKELKNLSDDSMEAIYSVAFNLYQGGRYDEAKKVFQFLCFYDHYNKKYFLGLGACQMMQQDFETAVELFSFASALDTDDPRAMLYIGDCHMAMGKPAAAKVAYETAAEWAGDQEEYREEHVRAINMAMSASAVIEEGD